MRSACLWILILACVSAAAAAADPPRVQGSVLLLDEENARYERFPLPAFVDIRFGYAPQEGNRVTCPGQGRVDSSTWEFEYIIHESCHGRDLTTEVAIRPVLDWTAIPPPKVVIWQAEATLYQIDVPIRRPKKITKALRQAYFNKGRELTQTEPAEAIAYFAEAARGDDLEFAAAAADFLEKQQAHVGVYYVLATKKIDALPADDLTKFRLAMRKGNAARAGGLIGPALMAYGEAQKIFPRSHQPVGLAYTVALQQTGVAGPSQLADQLDTQPQLWQGLQGVLVNWSAAGDWTPGTSANANLGVVMLAGQQAEVLAERGVSQESIEMSSEYRATNDQ